MLYYDRLDVCERIDVNTTIAQKECCVFHYWYFLNYSLKFQPNVCNRFHDLLMTSININDIAISNIKSSEYCCIIRLISKTEATNFMQNAELIGKNRTL